MCYFWSSSPLSFINKSNQEYALRPSRTPNHPFDIPDTPWGVSVMLETKIDCIWHCAKDPSDTQICPLGSLRPLRPLQIPWTPLLQLGPSWTLSVSTFHKSKMTGTFFIKQLAKRYFCQSFFEKYLFTDFSLKNNS